MGSHQSCLTQFLNTGHGVFSCSNTETKPTTGFGDEEGRSESIPYAVSEKWLLRMQPCLPEGLTPAKSAATSKLVLFVSDLKQGNLNQMITLEDVFFSCHFSYIVINPMTRWWGLVLRLKTRVPESLDFLLSASYKHCSKSNSHGHDMLHLPWPYTGLHCFFLTRIRNSYLFIVMETDNWHWSIMTLLIDSWMTSCNVTFVEE